MFNFAFMDVILVVRNIYFETRMTISITQSINYQMGKCRLAIILELIHFLYIVRQCRIIPIAQISN